MKTSYKLFVLFSVVLSIVVGGAFAGDSEDSKDTKSTKGKRKGFVVDIKTLRDYLAKHGEAAEEQVYVAALNEISSYGIDDEKQSSSDVAKTKTDSKAQNAKQQTTTAAEKNKGGDIANSKSPSNSDNKTAAKKPASK